MFEHQNVYSLNINVALVINWKQEKFKKTSGIQIWGIYLGWLRDQL